MQKIENILSSVAKPDINAENNLWKKLPELINLINKDGATFILHADGEREKNTFTMLIQGGPLKQDYIRYETSDLLTGLGKIFAEYSNRF